MDWSSSSYDRITEAAVCGTVTKTQIKVGAMFSFDKIMAMKSVNHQNFPLGVHFATQNVVIKSMMVKLIV